MRSVSFLITLHLIKLVKLLMLLDFSLIYWVTEFFFHMVAAALTCANVGEEILIVSVPYA